MERQALIDASVQPGGRAPAPEPLALVQAFVNTVDREHGPDLLDERTGWAAWCAARDLTPDRDRDDVRAVREALRALLWANAHADAEETHDAALADAVATLDAAADRARLRPRFSPARLDHGGGALAAVLSATFTAMADGSWPRLKACPGADCGWVFYDRSVNGSSGWCSMRVCGQRAKARAYYARQRA
ncbi:MAG TPA: CGNR zinc finger domain-containing protein [Solirubrobacteraceae bacterium]|nr:CGNR zinc finger domain-containing protein [Solirubrobacteraceae bacterium]